MFAFLSQSKDPIWHTVSCACEACIAADELWINRYGYTLRYGKRPLFASASALKRVPAQSRLQPQPPVS